MIDAQRLRAVPTEDLRNLNHLVVAELKHRRAMEQAMTARNFKIGDAVKFFSTKRGDTVRGFITQVNRVTVHLEERGLGGVICKWRVAPSLLQYA